VYANVQEKRMKSRSRRSRKERRRKPWRLPGEGPEQPRTQVHDREGREGGFGEKKKKAQEHAQAAVNKSWTSFQETGGEQVIVGLPAAMEWPSRETNDEAAKRATKFRGKVQTSVAEAVASGSFMASAAAYTRTQIEKRWAERTRKAKGKVMANFKDFLEAAGLGEEFLSTDDFTKDKSRKVRLQEEEVLAAYALMRLMAGQAPSGVLQYVSHIRTGYEHVWRLPFGYAGSMEGMSYTSKMVWSMREFFPRKDDEDQRREPVSRDDLALMMRSAKRELSSVMATVMSVAWHGLFRMGELTATDRAFDWKVDVSENDVDFIPGCWNARYVRIRQGPTKADQSGQRRKKHPRLIPVTTGESCAGKAVRDMLVLRYELNEEDHPAPMFTSKKPLFQSDNGKQLQQRQVLADMRRWLSVRYDDVSAFGTHSFRIGGFNHLFKMGAPIEVIKNIGGWASDAWREYLRVTQVDSLELSRRMTLE
jgi:hypothetical protein